MNNLRMTKLLLSAWNMNVLFKNNYVKLMVRLEKELRITGEPCL